MTGERNRLPELEARPAVMRAVVAGKDVVQIGNVVSMTKRTILVEVDDAAAALALSLAPTVEVDVDDGSAVRTVTTTPGSRADDNPTSRRVELVRQDVDA